MEKKKLISIILFIIGFIATYLIMCYCIPGLRIKLTADSKEYFIKSMKNAILFKSIVSCIIGIIFAMLPYSIKHKREK